MAVLWVVHHAGPQAQQRLAETLDVSARNISGLVDALAAAGYVERTPHPTDRRAHLVALTARGRTLMETTVAEHAALSATLRDAVAPADRPALERGLTAVVGRLAELVAAGRPGGKHPDAGKTEARS